MLREGFLTALILADALAVTAADVCTDPASCQLPGAPDREPGNIFKVYSPVGASSVNPIKQTPSLKTLSGKTIAITGDASRNKAICVPGGGMASVKIELPAAWDKLMQAKGYEPLKKFHLQTTFQPEKIPANSAIKTPAIKTANADAAIPAP